MSIELKQIVYNLEDYGGSGGLISTNKNNHNELLSFLGAEEISPLELTPK